MDEQNGLTFTPATKEQSLLKLAIFGPSGSGKTYSSLRIATGLIGDEKDKRIALIDTERGSASKYADRFSFDVLNLPQHDIDTYIQAIKAASGYDILIIDSLTHAWHELLGEVDRLAKAKYRGNTWSAWSEGTPKQRALVNALLDFPGHIIATMRTKTEWTTAKDEKTGKTRPIKVGLAPEQGKGIEYEFDMLIELTDQHFATVSKDRTGRFQDAEIEKPGEDFGKELAEWLGDGKSLAEIAADFMTNSGQRLGDFSVDELSAMVQKINALRNPSNRMRTIKQYCLMLGATDMEPDEQDRELPESLGGVVVPEGDWSTTPGKHNYKKLYAYSETLGLSNTATKQVWEAVWGKSAWLEQSEQMLAAVLKPWIDCADNPELQEQVKIKHNPQYTPKPKE